MSPNTCPHCGSIETKGRYAESHTDLKCIFLVSGPCPYASHTHWKCKRCQYKWVLVHKYWGP